MSDPTPGRSAPDLGALRAAVHRIEGGESTGLFDDLPVPASRARKRASAAKRKQTAAPARSEERSPGAPAEEWQGSAPPPQTAPDWAVVSAGDDVVGGGRAVSSASATGATGPATGATGPAAGATAPAAGATGPAAGADGAEYSADEEDEDADAYAVARQIVLRQLTMAPRSRHQLRAKLRQRNCRDDVAEAVLDRLTEVGLVDDEKFAESLVRSNQVSRGLSVRALAHELRQKGVDKETAEAVLEQVNATEEEERARDLVARRLPRLRGLERDTVMRRLAGMLARKGYPSGLSLQVIRQAIDADPAFGRD